MFTLETNERNFTLRACNFSVGILLFRRRCIVSVHTMGLRDYVHSRGSYLFTLSANLPPLVPPPPPPFLFAASRSRLLLLLPSSSFAARVPLCLLCSSSSSCLAAAGRNATPGILLCNKFLTSVWRKLGFRVTKNL